VHKNVFAPVNAYHQHMIFISDVGTFSRKAIASESSTRQNWVGEEVTEGSTVLASSMPEYIEIRGIRKKSHLSPESTAVMQFHI
jgi:hypothetical protein